jgi:hypothetical protein
MWKGSLEEEVARRANAADKAGAEAPSSETVPSLRENVSEAQKSGNRHGRACPGHPRIAVSATRKTWMPGTRPGMTEWVLA